MSVNENQPDAQRLSGRAGMLQPTQHARERTAIGEQPHRNVAAAPFSRDHFCELSVGESQAVPLAVSQSDSGNRLGAAMHAINQFLDAALLQIVGPAGTLRGIPLADVRHFDEGDVLRKSSTEANESEPDFHKL